MKLVRIFLLWEDFQTTPTAINNKSVEHLNKVAELALEAKLLLDITFFTGHMSGPNWIPEWLLLPDTPMNPEAHAVISGGEIYNCGYRNFYSDELVLKAQQLLLRTIVASVPLQAVGLWNLANEPDLVSVPSVATAAAWLDLMVATIRELDPSTPITCGFHAPTLGEEVGFHADMFDKLDVPVIHGYPMYAAGWAQNPLDPQFVPGLCGLTSALNKGRPTLAEEFGGCTKVHFDREKKNLNVVSSLEKYLDDLSCVQLFLPWPEYIKSYQYHLSIPTQSASILFLCQSFFPGPSGYLEFPSYGAPRRQFMAGEEEFAQYLAQVLDNLVRVGSSGALLWCWADYVPELYGRPPLLESVHERFFGLVRADGSLKPHAETIRLFAQLGHTIRAPSGRRFEGADYYKEPGKSRELIRKFYV